MSGRAGRKNQPLPSNCDVGNDQNTQLQQNISHLHMESIHNTHKIGDYWTNNRQLMAIELTVTINVGDNSRLGACSLALQVCQKII